VQSAFDVHVDEDGLGSQTDFVQVNPEAHGIVSLHPAKHCPSAHISLFGHWLEYSHTEAVGSHAPAMHSSPVEHSDAFVQAQGPFVPPHGGGVTTSGFASALASAFASALASVFASALASAFASAFASGAGLPESWVGSPASRPASIVFVDVPTIEQP
jgi:hypothetical protein